MMVLTLNTDCLREIFSWLMASEVTYTCGRVSTWFRCVALRDEQLWELLFRRDADVRSLSLVDALMSTGLPPGSVLGNDDSQRNAVASGFDNNMKGTEDVLGVVEMHRLLCCCSAEEEEEARQPTTQLDFRRLYILRSFITVDVAMRRRRATKKARSFAHHRGGTTAGGTSCHQSSSNQFTTVFELQALRALRQRRAAEVICDLGCVQPPSHTSSSSVVFPSWAAHVFSLQTVPMAPVRLKDIITFDVACDVWTHVWASLKENPFHDHEAAPDSSEGSLWSLVATREELHGGACGFTFRACGSKGIMVDIQSPQRGLQTARDCPEDIYEKDGEDGDGVCGNEHEGLEILPDAFLQLHHVAEQFCEEEDDFVHQLYQFGFSGCGVFLAGLCGVGAGILWCLQAALKRFRTVAAEEVFVAAGTYTKPLSCTSLLVESFGSFADWLAVAMVLLVYRRVARHPLLNGDRRLNLLRNSRAAVLMPCLTMLDCVVSATISHAVVTWVAPVAARGLLDTMTAIVTRAGVGNAPSAPAFGGVWFKWGACFVASVGIAWMKMSTSSTPCWSPAHHAVGEPQRQRLARCWRVLQRRGLTTSPAAQPPLRSELPQQQNSGDAIDRFLDAVDEFYPERRRWRSNVAESHTKHHQKKERTLSSSLSWWRAWLSSTPSTVCRVLWWSRRSQLQGKHKTLFITPQQIAGILEWATFTVDVALNLIASASSPTGFWRSFALRVGLPVLVQHLDNVVYLLTAVCTSSAQRPTTWW